MGRAGSGFEPWLVVLGSISLAAWSVLAFGGSMSVVPALCSSGAGPAIPLSVAFDLALTFNSPARLASGWALMLAAMMLPVVAAPLRHVRDRKAAHPRDASLYPRLFRGLDGRGRGSPACRAHSAIGLALAAAVARRCFGAWCGVAGFAGQAMLPEPLPSPAATRRIRRGRRSRRFQFRADQRRLMRRRLLDADAADAACREGVGSSSP